MTAAPLGRRSLLAAAALSPVAGSVRAAGAPAADGRLIALHAEFDRLQRQLHILFAGPEPETVEADDAFEAQAMAICDQQALILDELTTLHAISFAGLAARMRTLTLEGLHLDPAEMIASEYFNQRLLGLMLRDLVALADTGRADA